MGKHKIVITERDEKILGILKKFGYLREDFLARYLAMDYNDNNVKNLLNVLAFRLKKHDIIKREKIKIGKTFYWWLGKIGAEIVEAIPIQNISIITLNHNDLVADLAIEMLVKNPDLDLKTEYELKQEVYGKKAKEKKIPDLIINETDAIEVEISKKNNKRWINCVSQYLAAGYSSITYYTNSISIANSITRICYRNEKFKFKIFKNSEINKHEDFEYVEQEQGDFETRFAGNSKLMEILGRTNKI
jgi:hypothetical protein